MTDLGSFLAHVESMTKAQMPGSELAFSNTHVFNLGDDENIEKGIVDIWEDLKDDMKAGVPMPFKDMSCVSMVRNVRNPFSKTGEVFQVDAGWIYDRVVDLPILDIDRKNLRDLIVPDNATENMREAAKNGPVQKLAIIRVEHRLDMVISWICYFYGVIDGALMLTALPTQQMGAILGREAKDDSLVQWFMEESRPVLKQIAVISHPANYIVNVKPKLTPKEERKVASGKSYPTQKMPHFVVVDHDVLVGMSGRDGESHASPVPHHRRGHWMRLAERCREARASGKERVWVRPTYVGDTKFADLKNDYEVLMDFGKKPELAIV